MTTSGQNEIIDLAQRVEENPRSEGDVAYLQGVAGVGVDGDYGPVTAGVVEFVLDRPPPPTRSGTVSPYTPLEGSAMEAYLDGFLIETCMLKAWMERLAGIAPPAGKWDAVSEDALRQFASEWDLSPEFRAGLVGGIEHVQILPGKPSPRAVNMQSVASSWMRNLSYAYNATCPLPVEDEALVQGPTATPPVSGAQGASIAVLSIPIRQAPVSEMHLMPEEVNTPVVKAQNLPVVGIGPGEEPKEGTFQAPSFAVVVPEEAAEDSDSEIPTWAWVAGGVVLIGGIAYAVSKRR